MSASSTSAKNLQQPGWVRNGVSAVAGAMSGIVFPRLMLRLLRGVSCGTLTIELPDGQFVEGRGRSAGPHVSIAMHRWRAVYKLAMAGDLGMAEAYRDGDWSTPDLTALLQFGVLNEAGWSRTLDPSLPVQIVTRLIHFARSNTRRGSRQNISFHYDMGNDFYARWLDPSMIYSSALYAGDQSGQTETLESAQAAKVDRAIGLLGLHDNAEVLEIGCGWGALAIAMAKRHRAHVTGLTLSKEQLEFAEHRVAAEHLEQRIDLRLEDYRDVAGSFDHIVSIEMLEAVGEKYWPAYFETLRDKLRPGGSAVIQVITIADEDFEHYRGTTDFIQRFIFPGGMLPSVPIMQKHADRAGLTMETAEEFGASYATTLAEWRHRFLRAWPVIETQGFDLSFKRLWEYYLCYCEAGFRMGKVNVGLYVMKHASGSANETPEK